MSLEGSHKEKNYYEEDLHELLSTYLNSKNILAKTIIEIMLTSLN
jgi:hypothetical protein